MLCFGVCSGNRSCKLCVVMHGLCGSTDVIHRHFNTDIRPVLPHLFSSTGDAFSGRKEMLYLTTHSTHLRLHGVGHMVKYHSDSERGNPLPPHWLLFPISSKGSFICIIPQTG